MVRGLHLTTTGSTKTKIAMACVDASKPAEKVPAAYEVSDLHPSQALLDDLTEVFVDAKLDLTMYKTDWT